MIKVDRKLTEKANEAIGSLKREKAKNGSYNTPEVNAALKEMFHGKCYICEDKESSSYQIEHLIPHRRNVELKYDWNNLFLACAHCNNIKLDKFDPIIDCTKENVEERIAFRKEGYFGTDEKLIFDMLDSRIEIQNTVKLLHEVYYGSTPQKKIEAKIIRKRLRKELSEFKERVRDYKEAEGEERDDLKYLLQKQLKDSSPFVAFKRWLIRDNKEAYPELLAYIDRDTRME